MTDLVFSVLSYGCYTTSHQKKQQYKNDPGTLYHSFLVARKLPKATGSRNLYANPFLSSCFSRLLYLVKCRKMNKFQKSILISSKYKKAIVWYAYFLILPLVLMTLPLNQFRTISSFRVEMASFLQIFSSLSRYGQATLGTSGSPGKRHAKVKVMLRWIPNRLLESYRFPLLVSSQNCLFHCINTTTAFSITESEIYTWSLK